MYAFIRCLAGAAGAVLLAACGNSLPPGSGTLVAGAAKTCVTNAANYNEPAGAVSADMPLGVYSVPFCEEKILSDYTDEQIPNRGQANPERDTNYEHCARREEDKFFECKPTAGSIALLPDNRLVYWNALESTENVEFNAVKEGGDATINDQSRLLTLGGSGLASWARPVNNDGGAVNPDVGDGDTPDDNAHNDGALFCSHQVNLFDGRVLAAGGTDYYTDSNGAIELEGLKNARIFGPADDTWRQTANMAYGRWYPTMVTLASGDVFIASGVRKLLKPVYDDDRPEDSNRNVVESETYDIGCQKWLNNNTGQEGLANGSADRSLPLFPRLHLLPNNQVLFVAAGQAFNPFGGAYDQALWNFMAAYNPATRSWTDLGMPGSEMPGFRGSTSNIMMPLIPDANGEYKKIEFLTMGGTVGGSPGNPTPIAQSRIDTVTIGALDVMTLATRDVGSLAKGRWYGHAVLLPSGQVMLFSGADNDEVQSPGSGVANIGSEMFDPISETWKPMALQGRQRTYHNSALLLPDGRVLVGGHAPIPNNYAYNSQIPGKSPQNGRDPSFEIFSPAYMFMPRPTIESAASTAAHGDALTVATPDAANIDSVVLVRRTAITHLLDGDQRSVVLPILSRGAGTLNVRIPAVKAVLPPGHYMLFILKKNGDTLVPSVSAPVLITGADLGCG